MREQLKVAEDGTRRPEEDKRRQVEQPKEALSSPRTNQTRRVMQIVESEGRVGYNAESDAVGWLKSGTSVKDVLGDEQGRNKAYREIDERRIKVVSDTMRSTAG